MSHVDGPAMDLLAAHSGEIRRCVVNLGCQWKGCPDEGCLVPEDPLQACSDTHFHTALSIVVWITPPFWLVPLRELEATMGGE